MPLPTRKSAKVSKSDLEFPYQRDSSVVIDLKRRHLDIPPGLDWYTEIRDGNKGDHLSGLFEVDKNTFEELFTPNLEELKILDSAPGPTIILKIYDQFYINQYYKKYRTNELIDFRDADIFDYQDAAMKMFENEVKINNLVMKHNSQNISKPENQISSPKMIKYGTIFQPSVSKKKRSIIARYIAMEKAVVTTKVFRKTHILSAKRSLNNLHNLLNIAHLDISLENVGVQEFPNGTYTVWFFDYKKAEIIQDESKKKPHFLKDSKRLLYILENHCDAPFKLPTFVHR